MARCRYAGTDSGKPCRNRITSMSTHCAAGHPVWPASPPSLFAPVFMPDGVTLCLEDVVGEVLPGDVVLIPPLVEAVGDPTLASDLSEESHHNVERLRLSARVTKDIQAELDAQGIPANHRIRTVVGPRWYGTLCMVSKSGGRITGAVTYGSPGRGGDVVFLTSICVTSDGPDSNNDHDEASAAGAVSPVTVEWDSSKRIPVDEVLRRWNRPWGSRPNEARFWVRPDGSLQAVSDHSEVATSVGMDAFERTRHVLRQGNVRVTLFANSGGLGEQDVEFVVHNGSPFTDAQAETVSALHRGIAGISRVTHKGPESPMAGAGAALIQGVAKEALAEGQDLCVPNAAASSIPFYQRLGAEFRIDRRPGGGYLPIGRWEREELQALVAGHPIDKRPRAEKSA